MRRPAFFVVRTVRVRGRREFEGDCGRLREGLRRRPGLPAAPPPAEGTEKARLSRPGQALPEVTPRGVTL